MFSSTRHAVHVLSHVLRLVDVQKIPSYLDVSTQLRNNTVDKDRQQHVSLLNTLQCTTDDAVVQDLMRQHEADMAEQLRNRRHRSDWLSRQGRSMDSNNLYRVTRDVNRSRRSAADAALAADVVLGALQEVIDEEEEGGGDAAGASGDEDEEAPRARKKKKRHHKDKEHHGKHKKHKKHKKKKRAHTDNDESGEGSEAEAGDGAGAGVGDVGMFAELVA